MKKKKKRAQTEPWRWAEFTLLLLQSLEMGGPSSELLQLLIYFSIITFAIKFITKVCLLSASSAVLFRCPPPSADA